jgi:hypothetical protein
MSVVILYVFVMHNNHKKDQNYTYAFSCNIILQLSLIFSGCVIACHCHITFTYLFTAHFGLA